MVVSMIRYEISAEHNNYTNLTVYDRTDGDMSRGWRVNANDGYVMYDPTVELGEQEEIYYSKVRYLPRNYDWSQFSLVAVQEDKGGDQS